MLKPPCVIEAESCQKDLHKACCLIKSSIIINQLILNCVILKEARKRPNKMLKIQNIKFYNMRSNRESHKYITSMKLLSIFLH